MSGVWFSSIACSLKKGVFSKKGVFFDERKFPRHLAAAQASRSFSLLSWPLLWSLGTVVILAHPQTLFFPPLLLDRIFHSVSTGVDIAGERRGGHAKGARVNVRPWTGSNKGEILTKEERKRVGRDRERGSRVSTPRYRVNL